MMAQTHTAEYGQQLISEALDCILPPKAVDQRSNRLFRGPVFIAGPSSHGQSTKRYHLEKSVQHYPDVNCKTQGEDYSKSLRLTYTFRNRKQSLSQGRQSAKKTKETAAKLRAGGAGTQLTLGALTGSLTTPLRSAIGLKTMTSSIKHQKQIRKSASVISPQAWLRKKSCKPS